MDQGGCLERLPRELVGQPGGGEPAQLVVDQRQEPIGREGLPRTTASNARVTAVLAGSGSFGDGAMTSPWS